MGGGGSEGEPGVKDMAGWLAVLMITYIEQEDTGGQ